MISNSPRIKFGLIRAVREQLEHRALWLYLIVDEARRQGQRPEEFAPAAIRRCGHYQGGQLVAKGQTTSLKGLRQTLFSKPAQWVFEMKIRRSTDDHLDIDFHYCPLVAAWQKQGCSDEEIAELCRYAMNGDEGIAGEYGAQLELGQTIATGAPHCQIRISRVSSSSD